MKSFLLIWIKSPIHNPFRDLEVRIQQLHEDSFSEEEEDSDGREGDNNDTDSEIDFDADIDDDEDETEDEEDEGFQDDRSANFTINFVREFI